jgi:23S rRNA (uracil1939-C5)-methyltransferase
MQHLEASSQVAIKQRVLEDNLAHLGKVKPERVLRPIEGPTWGYRFRARLSVRYVARKETVLVGFHERKSRYVADMSVCPVLPPHVSAMLVPLRGLIGRMQARDTLPQIELAIGDGVTALVLRHLEPLSEGDQALCGPSRSSMACSGGCSPRGRTRCTCWTATAPSWATACPSSACACPSSRPISRRSITRSTPCWSGGRCVCWMRDRTSG